MEEKYRKIYDFISITRVICSLLAILYVAYWFLKIAHFPLIQYIGIFLNPPIDFLKLFLEWNIEHNGIIIDMVPVIVAVLFQAFHFALHPFLGMIEKIDNKHKLNVIAEKKLEEKLVNENLKEIFVSKTMEYNKFGILLVLNVKSGIDENMLDKRPDYREIIRDRYMKIVNLIRRKYATCKAIMPGKLFMVYDNFALFDDFLSDILSEVKAFCAKNNEQGLASEFTFIIDAIKDDASLARVLDNLEKISTLSYTNKALATMPFNIRYKLNNQNKFILETMGISRFFEKTPDNMQKSIDFELFSIKTAKRK